MYMYCNRKIKKYKIVAWGHQTFQYHSLYITFWDVSNTVLYTGCLDEGTRYSISLIQAYNMVLVDLSDYCIRGYRHISRKLHCKVCRLHHVLMNVIVYSMGSTVNIRLFQMAPLLHSNPINHWIKLKTSSDAGCRHAKNQSNHWMVGLWSTGLVPIRALLLLPSSGVLDARSFELCSAKWLLIKPINHIRLKLLCVT